MQRIPGGHSEVVPKNLRVYALHVSRELEQERGSRHQMWKDTADITNAAFNTHYTPNKFKQSVESMLVCHYPHNNC